MQSNSLLSAVKFVLECLRRQAITSTGRRAKLWLRLPCTQLPLRNPATAQALIRQIHGVPAWIHLTSAGKSSVSFSLEFQLFILTVHFATDYFLHIRCIRAQGKRHNEKGRGHNGHTDGYFGLCWILFRCAQCYRRDIGSTESAVCCFECYVLSDVPTYGCQTGKKYEREHIQGLG